MPRTSPRQGALVSSLPAGGSTTKRGQAARRRRRVRRMTSPALNPYAHELGDREPIAVLRATVAALGERLGSLSAVIERRPSPERWSPREIVCHLADVEIVHYVRLRQ